MTRSISDPRDEDSEDERPLLVTRQESKIKELEATIRRLRASRDLHRSNSKDLLIENEELKEQIKLLSVKEEDEEVLDSDIEDLEQQPRRIQQRMKSLTPTPTPAPSPMSAGTNKKYPDVPIFNGDRNDWESWRLHLMSKFRASAMLYPSEQDKIEYIRDHCRSTAFDVIKARADLDSDDPYVSAKEMLEDLHSMFGDLDKVARCDAQLHTPSFAMKTNETFDEFYTRFSSTIAPLRYSDIHKISSLKRLIAPKLRYQISDGTTPSSFRQFVERLRQCDLDLRLAEQRARYLDDDDDDVTFLKESPLRPEEYPEDFKAKLKQLGLCLRCLTPGHRPKSTPACQQATPLTYEEAKAVLAKT